MLNRRYKCHSGMKTWSLAYQFAWPVCLGDTVDAVYLPTTTKLGDAEETAARFGIIVEGRRRKSEKLLVTPLDQ